MKRTVIIFIVFALLGALIFSTGCALTCGDQGTMRGCGYECFSMCADDNFVGGYAEMGKDYTRPEIWFEKTGDASGTIFATFEVNRPLEINMELCVMQDGIILTTEIFNCYDCEVGTVNVNRDVQLTSYNPEGGSVYVILNKISGELS